MEELINFTLGEGCIHKNKDKWETSAFTTVPPLLPNYVLLQGCKTWKHDLQKVKW